MKEGSCKLSSFVRGYHDYMDIWNTTYGNTDLEVKHKENEHDQFAIGIFHDKRVVGYVPKNFRKIFY